MRYGYWNYVYTAHEGQSKTLVNYGDYFQCNAILSLYKQLGIDRDDIITFYSAELLNKHLDEDILLPLQWDIFSNCWMDGPYLRFPKQLKVRFIGATLKPKDVEIFLNAPNIKVLKELAPIGCRDLYTLGILRKNGIEAYCMGCITTILPKREPLQNAEQKVMFIDAPLSLKKYIPDTLQINAEYFSQQEYVDFSTNVQLLKEKILQRYDYYEQNASLIVSSRMHVALPSLAKGIPTIFVKEQLDNRLSIIQHFISLYGKDDFAHVNWQPNQAHFEGFKQLLLQGYAQLLLGKQADRTPLNEISLLYESDVHTIKFLPHFTDVLHQNFAKALSFLEKKYENQSSFPYSIWGLSPASNHFYELMKTVYPNATLQFAVDTYKTGVFHGVEIVAPSQVDFFALDNMMVLAVSVCNYANSYFQSLRVQETRYCLCAEMYLHP